MAEKYPLGTKAIPRPRAWRLRAYIRAMGWVLAGLALVFGILALVQIYFHPFDLVIEEANRGLAVADSTLSKDAVSGISLGSLALVGIVASLPLFKKGVRRHQYWVSFWRGLLSSAIFLCTDKLYRYVQDIGILYLTATLALFVGATIVLVEIVSRAGRIESEADTRTELLASIASGLIFGLLVQLGEYALKALGLIS